jgi:hypothetical protein
VLLEANRVARQRERALAPQVWARPLRARSRRVPRAVLVRHPLHSVSLG